METWLYRGPVERPCEWLAPVNEPMMEAEEHSAGLSPSREAVWGG